MLIGLAAKNAILIVEFAKMEYDQGKGLVDAALNAAKLRFRPILMTAFAFILGVVPLLTASGAGAEARKVMGMTVFSGMLDRDDPRRAADSDVVRGRGEGDWRLEAARAGGWRRAASEAGHRAWAGRALRWTGASPPSARSVTMARLVAVGRMRASAQLRTAADADAAAVPFRRGPRKLNRSPTSPWFQVFDDPTLQALIREGIDRNLDLRVAVARVEEARARAGIAKSFLYPQVDGVANYGVRQASTRLKPTTRRIRAAPTDFSCLGRSTCSDGSGVRRRPRPLWCWRVSRVAEAFS